MFELAVPMGKILQGLSGAPVVRPLYERHLSGSENHDVQDEIHRLIVEEGRYPNRRQVLEGLSLWESPTQLILESMHPSAIFFDSTNSNSSLTWIMAHAGDPWLYRGEGEKDMFIVAGDLPTGASLESIPPEHREGFAIYDLYKRRTASIMELDSDGSQWQSRLKRIIQNDGVFSFLSSYFIHMAQRRLPEDSNWRKAIELFGTFVRVRAQLHGLFISPELVNNISPVLLRLTRPILRKTKHVNLRNGVGAIKLADAAMILGDEMTKGPLVAVFGNGHAGLDNVWGDPSKRLDVLKSTFLDLFEDAKKIAHDENIPLSPAHVIVLITSFSEILGKTRIWRVKKEPEDRTVTSVGKSVIPEADFVSPTIVFVAFAAAQEAFPEQFKAVERMISDRYNQKEE